MGDRYLVLSDMHFGTPQSSVNDPKLLEALAQHVAGGPAWREVVFTGDLLDANLSTFSHAIEGVPKGPAAGGARKQLTGFRDFLAAIDRAAGPGGGLSGVASGWVYLPGNHDYKVWDLLSSRVAFLDVLERGELLGSVPMPVQEHCWPLGQAFLAGLFRPYGAMPRVTVEYPDHLLRFGERTLVLTHGHYLDSSQTRGNDLSAHLPEGQPDGDRRREIHRIAVETAQYQAVASAVSYTRDLQRLVGGLVGPGGLADKLRKVFTTLATWLSRLSFAGPGALRGKAISDAMLRNIVTYLDRFRAYPPTCAWFVFGHTHRQGRAVIERPRRIEAFNVGSCYPDAAGPITFLEIEDLGPDGPRIQLKAVSSDGRVVDA